MATEWWGTVDGTAHAFIRPPCRSVCRRVSWTHNLYRAQAADERCFDCERDIRPARAEDIGRRIAEDDAPLSELELRWAYGDR